MVHPAAIQVDAKPSTGLSPALAMRLVFDSCQKERKMNLRMLGCGAETLR